jgi:hypothetical protein
MNQGGVTMTRTTSVAGSLLLALGLTTAALLTWRLPTSR